LMQMDLFSRRRKFSGALMQSGFLLQENSAELLWWNWGFFFRRRKVQQSWFDALGFLLQEEENSAELRLQCHFLRRRKRQWNLLS
jgi:hypothetical protein